MQNYAAVTNQAQNVAATPYSAYGGELVAPVNGQQSTGINAVNSASGIQNPYNAVAGGLAGASSGAIDPTTVNGSDIAQYESPYQSDVVNATEAEIQNQNQQQAAALQGNAISSGAFGGDRAGVAQAALAGQQDIASNATLANLNNQNYSQALGEANTQQSVGLSAAQNTAARQLAASQQLGTLGNTAQTEALTEANAQTNAGTLQQTTQQAQDTAAYNQFLQQQAYPFETTGWLANIVEGIGSQEGGSSSGTTTTQGSLGSQIAGGLLGVASFLPSSTPNSSNMKNGGVVPHRALGGGLGGVVYDPTSATGPTGLGGGSYVPQINLPVGHTMPNGAGGKPAGAQPAAAQTPQQQGQSIAQTANAISKLGNAFQNSSLGDSVSDAIQDEGDDDGFRRGGLVRGYDDGGTVVDPADILLAPDASTANVPLPTPRPADAPSGLTPATDPTFDRIIQAESNGKQFAADGSPLTSRKGALGIAQVMPTTGPEAAHYAGVPWDANKLATDPQYNAALGKAYYQHQLDTYGSPDMAAAAYNAGPGALNSAIAQAAKNGGSYLDYLPPETQAYVAKVAPDAGDGSALSFDNEQPQPQSAGLRAIDQAVGSGQTTNSRGDGFYFSPETRQLMLSAGLGIMGGTSRSALANIGAGGLAGIAAVNQNKSTAAEVGLKQAQTQGIQSENKIKQTTVQMMMNELARQAKGKASAATQMSNGAAPGVTSPTITSPTVASTVGATPTSGPATEASQARTATPNVPLDPDYDPTELSSRINAEKWFNAGAAKADQERLNQVLQSGRSRDARGNIVNLPGFADAQAQLEAAKPTQEQKNLSSGATQRAEELKGEITQGQKTYSGLQAMAGQYETDLQPYLDLSRSILNDPSMYTGVGADRVLDWNRLKASVGGDQKAAMLQEALQKVTATSVLGQINNQRNEMMEAGGNAGRIFSQQVDLVEKAAPQMSTTLGGNRFLVEVASRLGSLNVHLRDMAIDYRQEHGHLDSGFDKDVSNYMKQHPIFNKDELSNPALLGSPSAPPSLKSTKERAAWGNGIGLKQGDPFRVNGGYQYWNGGPQQ